MAFALGRLGQVAIAVADADRAEAFYGGVLGLRRLYRFGTLVVFDMQGVRLMIEQSADAAAIGRASVLYFACADIALAVRELAGRGAVFSDAPHLIARMEDHDLWMCFLADPDGHMIGLMQEAPKGYVPPTP